MRKVLLRGEEKLCARCHAWKHLNLFYPDPVNAGGRASYCKACSSAYNKARPSKKQDLEYSRQWRQRPDVVARAVARAKSDYNDPEKRAKRLVGSAHRCRAKRKGLSFDLHWQQIFALLKIGFCQKTGLPFDLSSEAQDGGNAFAASIDRIESNKGYSFDNVQLVCSMYNFGKNKHAELDFIAMCCAVAERHANDPAVVQRLKELRNAEF